MIPKLQGEAFLKGARPNKHSTEHVRGTLLPLDLTRNCSDLVNVSPVAFVQPNLPTPKVCFSRVCLPFLQLNATRSLLPLSYLPLDKMPTP